MRAWKTRQVLWIPWAISGFGEYPGQDLLRGLCAVGFWQARDLIATGKESGEEIYERPVVPVVRIGKVGIGVKRLRGAGLGEVRVF